MECYITKFICKNNLVDVNKRLFEIFTIYKLLATIRSEKDIELAKSVCKFLALYDKTCRDYHHKDVQRNCWNNIAIGFRFETGEVVKNNFENIREKMN